ncbi:DMT family transporter [Roseomonas stagni]|uniref:DMT family transporter n=1 Tax=Falsiroseomonas algicola TaxID=2716930 RepID=A0A6M1LJ71_9PROT|nr:DMT family transporter [Falsiroseomonas algicola]NGM20311.1 DMT family transporter [Falsiroseomonas algicola]
MSASIPPPPRPDDPVRGILLMLAAITLFSIADAMSKQLTQTLSPLMVAWIRFATFFLLALLFVARRGGTRFLAARRPWLQVARGLGVAGSALAMTFALRVLPLAEATAINFVSPAFITVLSVIFLAEKVGWRRWSAIAVGLVGVLIVVRPGSGVFQAAALLPLLTAAFWAGAVIATRKMAGAGGDPPETTLIWSAGVGFLLFTVLLPFGWQTPDAGQVGFGMLVGLVSSIPHALVVLAYRAAPASVLAPFSYVQLVTSSLVGFIGFGAVPDSWTFAGGAVIAAAGLYTAHRERVRAREARRIS